MDVRAGAEGRGGGVVEDTAAATCKRLLLSLLPAGKRNEGDEVGCNTM